MRLIRCMVVAWLVLSPWAASNASAQARSLSRVARYVGRLVWVVDRTGGTRLARVVSASDVELAVTFGGTAQAIPVAEITRVYVEGDSIRDGALIGALIGVPLGVLGCQGGSSECDVGGHALAGVLIYGGIGALIDWRHHGRTVLYRAPGR